MEIFKNTNSLGEVYGIHCIISANRERGVSEKENRDYALDSWSILSPNSTCLCSLVSTSM